MDYEEQLSAAKFRADRDMARQDAYVAESKLTDAIKEAGKAKRKAAERGKLLNESNQRVHDLKREVVKLRWELEKLRRDALRSEIVDQCMDNIEREIKLGVNSIAELLEIDSEIQELPIAEVCPRIVAEMEPRLLPKGYEWPRFVDGEPVRFGDVGLDVHGKRRKCYDVKFTNAGFTFILDDMDRAWWANDCGPLENPEIDPGKRVKRPAVLAADNKPLEVGQTVWFVEDGDSCDVAEVSSDGRVRIEYFDGSGSWHDASEFVHQRPVLDADGVTIKEGDTVYLLPGEWCNKFPCWGFTSGEKLEVIDLNPNHEVDCSIKCRKVGGIGCCFPQPSQLTHTKPEIDSWERIEEDAERIDETRQWGDRTPDVRDLVRRCKALAEKENGNE